MTDTYAAEILADSISPDGVRLTTLWVTFPRFILPEVNTHRMLSRNSNSSRAIPPELQIERVQSNPFVPETFNRRVKGMGVGEALTASDQDIARMLWLDAAKSAIYAARQLCQLDCDKSRINRLLEPFLWHSAVITATEWSNFFALRDHPAAQPEFQILARCMREEMQASVPYQLDYGQWHLPGLTPDEASDALAYYGDSPHAPSQDWFKGVSAGRLARWTSYDRIDEDPAADAYARAVKLISSFHLSPTEHQARPINPAHDHDGKWILHGYNPDGVLDDEIEVVDGINRLAANTFVGNFRGWIQYRKEIPNEHDAARAQALT